MTCRGPGVLVDPRTYDAEYHESVTKSGVPFLGDAMLKDVFASAVAVIVVVVIAAILGPKGPTGPPDPTLPGANPRPEWPFLWLFALLSLSPPSIETFIMLVFPVVLIVALFLVPFVSNRGERAPSRRPVAVLSVIVIYTVLGVLTYEGQTAPWSPDMTAWSGDAIPVRLVEHSSPLELQGAVVFQNKNCRNCHAIDGIGGRRGPDLTTVGVRLTSDQLIDQVSNGTPAKGAGRRRDAGLRQADRRSADDGARCVSGEPATGGPAAGHTGGAAPRRSTALNSILP